MQVAAQPSTAFDKVHLFFTVPHLLQAGVKISDEVFLRPLMMGYAALLWLFGLCSSEIQAHTHWMVTETGLIEPRVDSQFGMARPYDLLAFLNQDTRWENIIIYYHQLHELQVVINKLWSHLEMNTNINYLLSLDHNCHKAGPLNILDWYASHLEEGLSKHIDQEEFQLKTPLYGEDVDLPDCKKISSLTYSMAAFEHLEAMKNRDNLSSNAELTLPELISPVMTVEQFGHWVASVLRRNSSSWLHYNLASLYWRVRGNAPKALECSRRAVHYAPREYKNVALLSMGTTLHRTKRSYDATIVLESAVDHDPQLSHSHFVLANAYAVLGHYNSSIKHYEKSLRIDPAFETAMKNMYGVKCIRSALKRVDGIHKSLKELRGNLTAYSRKEADWLKSQAAFVRTMKHNEDFDHRNVERIVTKMSELTGLTMKDLKKGGDKNSLMQYFLDGPLYNPNWGKEEGIFAMESVYALQKLVKHIGKHAITASDFVIQPDLVKTADGKIVKEIGPMPVFPDVSRGKITIDLSKIDQQQRQHAEATRILAQEKKSAEKLKPKTDVPKYDDLLSQYERGLPLYPSNMKVSRLIHDFDREQDWPSEKVCKESGPTFPENVEVIYPVFLPFENKGLRLKGLLTDRLGVALNVEHELPWHPPICPANKEAVGFTQKKAQRQQMLIEVIPTHFLRVKLMEYVGDGDPESSQHMQDAEIGQRIHSAMQANVAPKWLIYTLTALYWRVRGNNANALSCLLTASKTAKGKYRDIVMTSLASVYLEMGFVDDALQAAEDSFRINAYEPATNFVIASIQMVKKNRNPQLSHLKQTIRVDPAFLGGLARSLLTGWACLLRQVLALKGLAELGEREMCKEVNRPGVKMCEGDENCRMSSSDMKCITHRERDSTSTIVRLMQIKDDSVQTELTDGNVLEPFISRMPLERSDLPGHQQNFELMIDIVRGLRGCGPKSCHSITPEDLALKEEDCTYQFLQIGYWMHIISFRQLIDDSELRLPSEILSMPPSTKTKIPECRVFSDPSTDFFLNKLYNVDVHGWEPLLSLMQQFGELFDFIDYSVLGAKIARFVETKARWWAAALGAGWWCGAGGKGECALRCLTAAYSLAPPHYRVHAVTALAALLNLQNKTADGKLVAQLAFYMSPKSNTEAFLLASSHTYHGEYEQAVWLYRYALTFDEQYLPAKACLHATMCVMLFADKAKPED